MIFKKYIYFILFLFVGFFFSNCASVQQRSTSSKAIKNLRENGSILFRLPSAERKIKYFESKGWTRQAKQEAAYVAAQNKALIAAFKAEFDFCPVYFFEAKESKLVEEGKLEAVHFLDENLNIDPSIQATQEHFITATFSDNFRDSEGYHSTTKGIILSDKAFYTLPKPFPRHAPKFFLFFKKTDARMVRKLNRKLNKYYGKRGM